VSSPLALQQRVASLAVSAREAIDKGARLNLAAHLRRIKRQRGIRSAKALAEKLGVSPNTMPKYLKGLRDIGLDLAIRMHRVFGVSLDTLVDERTDDRWYTYVASRDGELPNDLPGPGGGGGGSPVVPGTASGSPAQRRKHGAGGGGA